MLKRSLGVALAVATGAVLWYLSRFWIFSLWPREGLFGIGELRPQGGLVSQWLRGTEFAPFELILWACGVFLILSLLQSLAPLFASNSNSSN